jgi:ABC-type glycerol-3-phosphate transport system substrate-binding protein
MRVQSAATRKLRIATAIAVTAITALGLAGCGTPGVSGATDSATSGSVTWWGWTPQLNVSKVYIEAFNKEYPDIKINYKQLTIADYPAALRPALASGTGPDVFDVAPGAKLNEYAPYEDDLTPVVEGALGSDWKSKITALSVNDLTTTDGKLGALAVGTTFAGQLWINNDLFKKYNLTPPTTLDEWVQVCKDFAAAGEKCFVHGAGQEPFNVDFLHSTTNSVKPGFWADAVAGKADWTDPTFVQALTIWQSMFSNGVMQDGALGVQQYPDAVNAWLSGQYPMIMLGTWNLQVTKESNMIPQIQAAGVADPKTFTALPVPFPDVAGNGNPATLYGNSDYGLSINTTSKNKSAAQTFVLWMTTSKAGQQTVADTLNDIASLNGVNADLSTGLVNPDVQAPVISDLLKEAQATTETRQMPISDMPTAINTAATSVATGQATPAQAAATLQATWQTLLAKK